MPTDNDAYAHPGYERAVAHAVARAGKEPGRCFSVYFDGEAVIVRGPQLCAAPPNAKLVCIAQRWDDKTVQLRFDGARSEWRPI